MVNAPLWGTVQTKLNGLGTSIWKPTVKLRSAVSDVLVIFSLLPLFVFLARHVPLVCIFVAFFLLHWFCALQISKVLLTFPNILYFLVGLFSQFLSFTVSFALLIQLLFFSFVLIILIIYWSLFLFFIVVFVFYCCFCFLLLFLLWLLLFASDYLSF